MTQTDRQLLLAVIDGDLSAALAFLDRLEEVGDTRLNDTRRIIGKLINGVLDTCQHEQSEVLDYDEQFGIAEERVSLLEQAKRELFELFWVELLDREDVAKISQQLADAANFLKTEFADASDHDVR